MSAQDVTPNPAQIVIDVGDKTITIPDVSKPNWFGDYQGGKLAVYVVEVTGNVIEGSITVLATYTENASLGTSFTVYAGYEAGTDLEYIVSHLQSVVFDTFKISLSNTVTLMPASNTLH